MALACFSEYAYWSNSAPSVTGIASIRCVRPILTMPENFFALFCKEAISLLSELTVSSMLSKIATCMAVGKVSLLDCDILTWSFGLIIS